MKFLLSAFICIFLNWNLQAQTCTAPGQNPSTAFPVCGTNTFTQNSVPLCGGKTVPTSSCGLVTDVNPFWYKFTCFQSGTLGFKIKPHTNSEDYDWQLFDITGQNPNAVYSVPSLTISHNWSGESGETGASSAGTSLFVCDGFGKPLWSQMANIIIGHEYLLLISHFTNTQSGYDLSFGGGTAVITDTTTPHLFKADAACGGNLIRVKLNKKMKCSSLASNGSDFSITPGGMTISSVTGIGCSTGFDTDSLLINLSGALAPGTYSLNAKNGTDNNTLLDYCDNAMQVGDKVDFTVYPAVPTPMDSLAPVACAPGQLRLIFRKPMLCSSVAANGSDFTITGTNPVSITSAQGSCVSGQNTSKEIIITLSQPIYTAGTYTITLKTGTDGNTLLDECAKETPAGATINFTVKDTVNADFSFQKIYGCTTDIVKYFHDGKNGVMNWSWSLGDNQSSSQQNPQGSYTVFNEKTVTLIVSNGFCSDTVSKKVLLDNYLQASFDSYSDICPNEETQFTSTAKGIRLTHNWSFGDGTSSTQQSPKHIYSGPVSSTIYTVTYTVTDSIGCTSTVQKPIKVWSSCYLAVPDAFTPNNDGRNDMFYPLNAVKAENLVFKVFNRWGQLIFETKDWKQGWDGKFKGQEQATGVYVWFLNYTDRDTKEKRQLKGTVTLIR